MAGSLRQQSERGQAANYGLALAATALAVIVRFLLDPILGDQLPFLTFYITVIVSAWRGGIGPGLAALGLGIGSGACIFCEPRFSLQIADSVRRFDALRFSTVGAAILLAFEITHRRRRRSELQRDFLRRGEERYRAIFDQTLAGIAETDLTGRFVQMNRRFLEIAGRSRESLLELRMQDITHPDDLPANLALFEKAATDGTPFTIEKRYVRPNGSQVWVSNSVSLVRDERGGPCHLVAACLEITDRKREEEATRRRSEQLRRLAEIAARINAAPDTPAVLALIAEEARRLIGSHQSAVSVLADDKNREHSADAVSLSGKYDRWRAFNARPDGSGIYATACRLNQPIRMTQAELESHPAWKGFGKHSGEHPPMRGWLAAPLVKRDGANIGLLQLSDKCDGEFTDDDEAVLVQLAQMASVAVEKARLFEDLRTADRRKNEFLATLAHELRNPLAPIRTGLEVIRLANGRPEAAEEARVIMERQIGQMARLVDDLMDINRINQGKIELRKERVDLAAIINSAVETSRPLIGQMGQELVIALPKEPIVLDADLTRLAQVFLNLLNNAAKYSDRGGRIDLSVERQENEVLVSVRDVGIGIPPSHLPTIFEMFSQVEEAISRSRGGLGIGLCLAKRLAEMHGGDIEARSRGLGQGSEFLVRLPIAPQKPRLCEPSADEPAIKPRPLRFLVVDDN